MAMIYCRECGKKYSDKADCCPKCGYKYHNTEKSIAIYLVLCWFLGCFGVHRFYAHKTGSAIIMLILGLTLFGLIITCIWALIDFIIGLCNISTPDNVFDK